jgi:hypothetical protein
LPFTCGRRFRIDKGLVVGKRYTVVMQRGFYSGTMFRVTGSAQFAVNELPSDSTGSFVGINIVERLADKWSPTADNS